jgi:hypothetical protein
LLSAYEKRNKNFFRKIEIFPKLPAFFVENLAIFDCIVYCVMSIAWNWDYIAFIPEASMSIEKSRKHGVPDRESGELESRVNSGVI